MGFAAALRALDLPLFMVADGQGERHFAVALVAVVLVDGHGRPSLVTNWDGQRPLAAALPSRPALPGDARRHLGQILLKVLDLRTTVLDDYPNKSEARQRGEQTVT